MYYNLGLLQHTMAKIALIAAGNGKNMELALKFKEMAEEMGHSTDVMDLMGLEWPVITNKLKKTNFGQKSDDRQGISSQGKCELAGV